MTWTRRGSSGSHNGRAVLTEAQVFWIRQKLTGGLTPKTVLKPFRLAWGKPLTIRQAKSVAYEQVWRHVPWTRETSISN